MYLKCIKGENKTEKLREMVRSFEVVDSDKLLEEIPKVMKKVKEVSFLKVVQDDELKDFLPDMKKKMVEIDMAKLDLEKLKPLANIVLPFLFESFAELVESSDEIKVECEKVEDMSIQVGVPDMDIYMHVIIEGGKFRGGMGKIDNPELSMSMNKNSVIEQMQGKGNLVSSYLAGNILLEGKINKAMALYSIVELIADVYDIDLQFL